MHNPLRYRHLFLIGLTVLALSVIALTSPRAGRAQQDEPVFQPTILEDGMTAEDQFEDLYTAVLYGFNASAGDVVSISMNPPEGAELDTYLVLLADNGGLLAMDDDTGDDYGAPRFAALIREFELPYDGSYYVFATTSDFMEGIMGGRQPLLRAIPFEITVSGITPPEDLEGFDPTRTTITTTPLERATPIDVDFTAEAPVAYLAFDGTEGEIVSLESRAYEFNNSPIIHLFTPDGRRLRVSEAVDGSTQVANLDDIELPQDGRYLMMTMHVFFMDRIGYENSNWALGKVAVSLK